MPVNSEPKTAYAGAKVRWAVLGVGVAGRARARAIEADPLSELVAVYRGRFAEEFQVAQLNSLEDAIEAADAVAICSPTSVHAKQAAVALAAGRHVVVEFPMAEEPETARGLFEAAHEAARLLHVAHIELLGSAARALRQRVERVNIRSVSVRFQRSGSPEVRGASLALSNIARLHRVVDAVGPFARIDEVETGPGWLRAELRSNTGHPISLHFTQGEGLERETRLTIDDGRVWEQVNRALSLDGEPLTLPKQPGLFAEDHRVAVQRILTGGESYMSEARILHVLTMAAQLRDGEVGHLPFLVE